MTMGYNTKNHRSQGGESIHIGGEVILAADSVIVDQRPCPIAYVPASTASSAANAVKDLNVLIALLKDAKLIERKAPTLALSVAETEVEAVVGSEATLAIDARASDGRALSYQWYSNTTAANTGGTAIEGAVAHEYEPATSAAGVAYYYCIVGEITAGATKVFADEASEVCTVTVSAE